MSKYITHLTRFFQSSSSVRNYVSAIRVLRVTPPVPTLFFSLSKLLSPNQPLLNYTTDTFLVTVSLHAGQGVVHSPGCPGFRLRFVRSSQPSPRGGHCHLQTRAGPPPHQTQGLWKIDSVWTYITSTSVSSSTVALGLASAIHLSTPTPFLLSSLPSLQYWYPFPLPPPPYPQPTGYTPPSSSPLLAPDVSEWLHFFLILIICSRRFLTLHFLFSLQSWVSPPSSPPPSTQSLTLYSTPPPPPMTQTTYKLFGIRTWILDRSHH